MQRYCSGKKGKGKKGKFGWDYSGASHIAELHALLRATVMVSFARGTCRLGEEVLSHHLRRVSLLPMCTKNFNACLPLSPYATQLQVRRLKKDILKHLPPKQRTLLEVQVQDQGARNALHEGPWYPMFLGLMVSSMKNSTRRVVTATRVARLYAREQLRVCILNC